MPGKIRRPAKHLTHRPFRRAALATALQAQRASALRERDDLIRRAAGEPTPEESERIGRLTRTAAEVSKQIRVLYGKGRSH